MDINTLPYAAWLEDSLRVLIESGAERICIIGSTTEGKTYTGYHNCSISDKVLFAHYLQTDALMDELRSSPDYIKEIVDGWDDDDDDDEDDEEEIY